ncbi:MAG: hypothetical protein JWO56_2461 [Acidobacteria bacterium]|nr:hypothetical protein [Acidobacteriota bacterium]
MTELPYLRARRVRTEAQALKRRAATGIVLGFALLLQGLYRLFFVVGSNDALWRGVAWGGAIVLMLTILAPDTMAAPEAVMHWVGNHLFNVLLKALLVVVYLLLLVPLAPWVRKKYPVMSWGDAKPAFGPAGWEEKTLVRTNAAHGEKRRPLLLLPLILLGYFARQRQFVLMPVLLVMIILGLVLLFLQTSAIAPFIYTLF